ncbi:MAG: SGNH/GDSL hydrolase family protein [Clostridia bacterium]|nr:SGNH/GDSL hydrolase family protein [Clostridia bacterium]
MELKSKKINFLGDSITYGHGTTVPEENRFSTLIANETGAICRNYGIGGSRIAAQIDEPEEARWDYCIRALSMDKDADVIVVFGGTNDYGHGNAPLGEMSDRTPFTFYGAVHTLCTELLEMYPQADIVFLTPLHRCDEDNLRGDGTKSKEFATLKDYTNILCEVLEYYSIPILDLYRTSQMQPEFDFIRNLYMPDGLHPNDAGQKLLARKIIAYLRSL